MGEVLTIRTALATTNRPSDASIAARRPRRSAARPHSTTGAAAPMTNSDTDSAATLRDTPKSRSTIGREGR